jgi:hypothetical protein
VATPQRGVPLPERTSSCVRILWARAGQSVSCISFNSQVVGRIMHWGEGHSELCVSDLMDCAWCRQGARKLWYGWVFGRDPVKNSPVLLQLTETAVRSNLSLRDPGVDLRGARIELYRQSDGKGSTVGARVTLGHLTRGLPKDEPDVLAHLMRFYRLPAYPSGRDDLPERGES